MVLRDGLFVVEGAGKKYLGALFDRFTFGVLFEEGVEAAVVQRAWKRVYPQVFCHCVFAPGEDKESVDLARLKLIVGPICSLISSVREDGRVGRPGDKPRFFHRNPEVHEIGMLVVHTWIFLVVIDDENLLGRHSEGFY